MRKKITGYRVHISYTVTYDPASEPSGIGIFYPEGHTDLVHSNSFWHDFYNCFKEYSEEEVIAMAKEMVKQWVFAGRYQDGTIDMHSVECIPLYR